jgi:ParB-like chromosome segregation protein Spo0J
VIYVSRDGYVIDGHHRWAAAVGADSRDGLGDLKIRVQTIDMPISEVLLVANAFTEEFGIKRKSA